MFQVPATDQTAEAVLALNWIAVDGATNCRLTLSLFGVSQSDRQIRATWAKLGDDKESNSPERSSDVRNVT